MNHFWDVSLANVVTWLIVIVSFAGTQYVTTKLLIQRMNGFEKWVESHEKEAGDRDRLLASMQNAITKLTTLAEVAEKMAERSRYIRSSDPPPYYGPERRK